jgi:hypothetical protein
MRSSPTGTPALLLTENYLCRTVLYCRLSLGALDPVVSTKVTGIRGPSTLAADESPGDGRVSH